MAPIFLFSIWLFLPLCFWSDLRFLIHDNLDSNVPWILNLIRSEHLHAGPTQMLDHIFNGIPRFALQSEWFLYIWLFKFFEPKTAYVLHYIFIHSVAFIGVYLLAKDYLLSASSRAFSPWLALIFGLLPFWPTGSLSIAGIPLLCWAFENLYKKKNLALSAAILLLYALGGSFFFASVWVYMGIGIFYSIRSILSNTWRPFLIILSALVCLLMLGIAIEWRLFYNQFFLKTPSHRVMWAALEYNFINWKGWLGISLRHFLFGHYHFHSIHFPILILSSVWIGYVRIYKKNFSKAFWVLLGCIAISLIGIGQETVYYKTFVAKTPIDGLNLRFFALSPFLWILVLGIVINELNVFCEHVKVWLISFLFAYSILVGFGFWNGDYYGTNSAENLFRSSLILNKQNEKTEYMRWEDYYMLREFETIKTLIPLDERVACNHITPEIFQYHGYKTVGAYQYFIPLETKKSFNELMPYLDLQNPVNWYSRSYIEINDPQDVIDFNWTDLVRFYQVKYLVSNTEIKKEGLYLLGETGDIHIYQIGL